jgi:peptidoglycan hydrolase-like amidase
MRASLTHMIQKHLSSKSHHMIGHVRKLQFVCLVFLFSCIPLVVNALPVSAETVALSSPEAVMDHFVATHGGASAIGPAVSPLQEDAQVPGVYHRYYENFQLDYWPELAGTDYAVQPSLLGQQETRMRNFPSITPFESQEDVYYFSETGHSLRFGFLDFFLSTGGIQLLGYPISEELQDRGSTIQYFQRGALRYTPGATPAIRAEPLGRIFFERAYSPWQASIETTLPPSPIGTVAATTIGLNITNRGSATWEPTGPNATAITYRWKSKNRSQPTIEGLQVSLPARLGSGSSLGLNIPVVTPATSGQYELLWDIRINGRWMSEIGKVSGQDTLIIGQDAPLIRVAIMELGPDNEEDQQATVSATASFNVSTLSGSIIATLPAGDRISLEHEGPNIRLTIPNKSPQLISEPISIRTEPGFFMIVDEIQPGNLYRGDLEFRYSDILESAWLINILPVNDYLAGLIEQGEEAPWESLTASVITFRSYALAVQARLKIKNYEPFDIASSTTHTPSYFTRHMFYRGFVRELAGPRLRQAIEDTRGQVITFQGEIIEAPFFTQAGGYTISHKEAGWGRDRAWSPGVQDPVSATDWFIGHGVGMPLQSSNKLAKLGHDAKQIIDTYFIGVDIGYAY